MKKVLSATLIIITIFSLLNCSSDNKKMKKDVEPTDTFASDGYKLMEQKCFICHFAKPDPSKRNSMIAPPMVRVQQHYKPTYPQKKDFINAISNWVKNPTKEKTLMPGAVRKFDVMPHLGYSDNEIKKIAATLFDIDFGKTPMMKMEHASLKLNNGKKWKLNKNTIELIGAITEKTEMFRSENVEEYNQLGKEIFDKAKTILLDTSYTKETFNQLHSFFNNIEEPIHLLISAKSLNEAKKQQLILLNKFNKFYYFFE